MRLLPFVRDSRASCVSLSSVFYSYLFAFFLLILWCLWSTSFYFFLGASFLIANLYNSEYTTQIHNTLLQMLYTISSSLISYNFVFTRSFRILRRRFYFLFTCKNPIIDQRKTFVWYVLVSTMGIYS